VKSVVEISVYEMCSRRLFPPHQHALAAAADAAAAAGGTCGGRGSLRCRCSGAVLPRCSTTTFRFKMDRAAFHPSVTQHVKNESSALGKAKPGKVSRVSVATFLDLGFGFKVADLLGMGEEASLYDSAWRRSRAIRPIPLWDEDFSTGFRLRL
jgi:hypothetical protein